jgi:hypothetical protein
MQLMGSRRRVLAIAAIVAMGLAACGDDDETAETTTPPTTARPQGAASVTVDMLDYAYTVSGPLTAGGTLKITNSGREFHMIGIGRFKPGKTLADLQTVLSQAGPPGGGGGGGGEPTTSTSAATPGRGGGATTSVAGGGGEGEPGGEEEDPTAEIVEEVGFPGNFMSPGESAEVTVPNLTPGTYALVCFIPTEVEGPPHFAKGMISQLEVVEGSAPPPPAADATYRLAPGRAIEGPASLSAGRHTLRFEAASGSDQLEPSIGRLNPGATYPQAEEAFQRLFESEQPPPRNAAGTVPAQILFGGFDLEGVTSFYLTVDLRAGNYAIVAEDTDPETRPRPPREIINVRVA